jgi:hypothetical protein
MSTFPSSSQSLSWIVNLFLFSVAGHLFLAMNPPDASKTELEDKWSTMADDGDTDTDTDYAQCFECSKLVQAKGLK